MHSVCSLQKRKSPNQQKIELARAREGDAHLKNIWESVKKDLWVVLLDVVAVNLSYFLALIIRFYVGGFLRPVAVDRYLPAFLAFAPWYTLLCLLFFMGWRLYGGIWRYAGINDMNRIILANLSTSLIHVLGTVIFVERMPITYYLIGGVLQFVFVVCIRFGYRTLLVEKRKLRRGEKIIAVVVGSGENGRRVVKNLEESEVYKPIAVVGSGSGTMDGVLIKQELELKNVGAVFIADPLLPSSQREEIKRKCDEQKIELLDYTGYFSNLGGRLSLTELLSTIHAPFSVVIDGKETRYEDGAAALSALTERYMVVDVNGKEMRIKLERQKKPSTQGALDAAYAAVMGDEPPQGGSR